MVIHSKKLLRTLVGALKDKASLSKATIFTSTTPTSSPTTTADVAVLRVTTHQPSTSPPNPKHISSFLSFGRGSRLDAAAAITALTSRLGSTHDSTVALKCLLTIHHVIHHGSFILRDQLVNFLHPKAFGGHNHLNLSGFRHRSNHDSWANSSWVRWHARVLELLISCHKTLGAFVNERLDPDVEREKVTALLNNDLLRQMELLVGIMEEVSNAPDRSGGAVVERNNRLVGEVVRMVEVDMVAVKSGIVARMREIGERMDGIGFGDSVELFCLLKRLEENGGACSLLEVKGGGGIWSLVAEVKRKVASVAEDERRAVVRRETASESARISEDRVRLGLSFAQTVRFGSTRCTCECNS